MEHFVTVLCMLKDGVVEREAEEEEGDGGEKKKKSITKMFSQYCNKIEKCSIRFGEFYQRFLHIFLWLEV